MAWEVQGGNREKEAGFPAEGVWRLVGWMGWGGRGWAGVEGKDREPARRSQGQVCSASHDVPLWLGGQVGDPEWRA